MCRRISWVIFRAWDGRVGRENFSWRDGRLLYIRGGFGARHRHHHAQQHRECDFEYNEGISRILHGDDLHIRWPPWWWSLRWLFIRSSYSEILTFWHWTHTLTFSDFKSASNTRGPLVATVRSLWEYLKRAQCENANIFSMFVYPLIKSNSISSHPISSHPIHLISSQSISYHLISSHFISSHPIQSIHQSNPPIQSNPPLQSTNPIHYNPIH